MPALPTVRRRPDFDLSTVPRYWLDQDPFKTRLLDALSLLFPDGERFFIRSVRHFRDQITDPALQARVADFIYQEAQHGRQHELHNARLAAQGMPLTEMLSEIRTRLNRLWTQVGPLGCLALTCGAEHLTAVLGRAALTHPGFWEGADPNMRTLFHWHAIEELEHRDVAYDVMQSVAPDRYLHRTAYYTAMWIYFWHGAFRLQRIMLEAEGLWSPTLVFRYRTWLLGWHSLLASAIPDMLHYFRPGYHPAHLQVPEGPYSEWSGQLAYAVQQAAPPA